MAVYAGLKLVGQVGTGTYTTALNVTAALIISIVSDHFGLLNVQPHASSLLRVAGAVLMIRGVALISMF